MSAVVQLKRIWRILGCLDLQSGGLMIFAPSASAVDQSAASEIQNHVPPHLFAPPTPGSPRGMIRFFDTVFSQSKIPFPKKWVDQKSWFVVQS